MDLWDKSQREDRRRYRRENPSFSSTLLDAIYRSIDESNGEGEEQLILYRETMRRKQSSAAGTEEEEIVNFRRACMIEKWMDKKKVGDKVILRRNSMVDFDRKSRNIRDRDCTKMINSSSSSSESSCNARRFSSSESEFLTHVIQRPKNIKTSSWTGFERSKLQTFGAHNEEESSIPKQRPNHDNGFVKTKSKASKIYHDLKKVKQPISPGGRLANFLNSLFNGGSPKTKHKFSNSINTTYDDDSKSKSAQGSTCSSVSSFSRSCLSKTPSSRGKLGDTKRSVRFCPVSVIVDEDCRPCGHKSLQKDEERAILKKPTKKYGEFEAEEVNRGAFKSYHHQTKINGNEVSDNEDDEDDDDDAASCSSSDLFELDNLGIGRYQQELPVYETTHFNTNRAIANGMVL